MPHHQQQRQRPRLKDGEQSGHELLEAIDVRRDVKALVHAAALDSARSARLQHVAADVNQCFRRERINRIGFRL